MAKTLKKTVHELEIDLENFDVFDEQPAAGSCMATDEVP